jgi:MauM/NapG family ferredoxin protein
MSQDKPMPRRRFFREGLLELFKPLARTVEPLQRVAEELGRLEGPPAPVVPAPPERHWLRPPGSLEEQRYRETCSRSGECVNVCPARCIKLDYSGDQGEGVPYIEPNEMSCVLCTGLSCMHVCPSGALLPQIVDYIDMGVAVWHEGVCLRSNGQECTICVDRCPVGAKALGLEDGRVVVREGCTGCGVCQHDCPTNPKSITVLPKSAR